MERNYQIAFLTGIAGLFTVLGVAGPGPRASLAAEPKTPPTNLAAQSNNEFAAALYRRLTAENAKKNLFFSPFSLSSALTMTAEGARGETAEEMGRVLGFPAEARRSGDDAPMLPWNMSLIHAGMAELNKRFAEESPEIKKNRDKVDALRKQLDDLNRQARQEKDVGKHDSLARKSQQVAGELNDLITKVDQYEIRVANAIWGEKTFPFDKDYVDTVHRFYSTGGVLSTDFRTNYNGVRDQINGWVAEQTKNRIRDLIAPGVLTSDTRLVLTNAIYFRGEWAAKFEPTATHEETFQLAGGGKKTVSMMRQDYNWSASYTAINADGSYFGTPKMYNPKKNDVKLYPENGFTMLELPYKGGELSLVAILPQSADGLRSLERLLTSENLARWIGKLEARTVHVAMPKFRLEEEYPLAGTLKAMGMNRAFLDPGLNADGAQFGGLCSDADPKHQLYLGSVVHKAFVELSEKGTEAAAATYEDMPMPATEAREPTELEPFIPRFNADKPFAFLIRDRKSGSILFLGRMLQP